MKTPRQGKGNRGLIYPGFLVLQKLLPVTIGEKSFTYRGANRDHIGDEIGVMPEEDEGLATAYVEDQILTLPEHRWPPEWAVAVQAQVYEDFLEFTPDLEKAKEICDKARQLGYEYEAVCCAVEAAAAAEGLRTGIEYKLDKKTLREWYDSLWTVRIPPSFRLIGYDVAYFGGDFYSPLWQEMLGDLIEEHVVSPDGPVILPSAYEKIVNTHFWGHYTGCLKPHYQFLNENSLFPTGESADRFRRNYLTHPKREQDDFFIYGLYAET